MFRAGHFHAAEILRHLPDARVIRGHDDFAQRFRLLALLDDVLDERLAGDEREGFAGEPRRGIARGNDADDFHGPQLSHSCPLQRKPRRDWAVSRFQSPGRAGSLRLSQNLRMILNDSAW